VKYSDESVEINVQGIRKNKQRSTIFNSQYSFRNLDFHSTKYNLTENSFDFIQ